MKKYFKCFLLVLVIIPCLFLMGGCNSRVVVDIQKSSASTSLVDVYTITYSDGSTGSFSVENGKDGKDLSIEDIYQSAKDAGFTGSYLEFLEFYLEINLSSDNSQSINKACLSVVSVYAEINYETSNILNTTKNTAVSYGSGVIYQLDKTSGDAYIITNQHVVRPEEVSGVVSVKVKCALYGSLVTFDFPTNANGTNKPNAEGYPLVEYAGITIDCEYVGGSSIYDIAVLKISGSDVLKNSDARASEVADSNNLVVGQDVIAVGNPTNWGISATEGIVCVVSEYAPDGSNDNVYEGNRVIRIDAAVNGGNSGGGLFNGDGELIGIVNAKIIDESIDNIAYAIPSSIACKVADSLIVNSGSGNQKAYKANLGITYLAKNSRAVYNESTGVVEIQEEVVIKTVEENSLAELAGLKTGDRVVSILAGGKTYDITKLHFATELEWQFKVGDVVTFEIEGKTEKVNLVITADCFKYVD